MAKLLDKNKELIDYNINNLGAVLSKGKRQLFIIYKSVNAGKKARELIAENSFNRLFLKGNKIRKLGSNTAYLKLD